MRVLHSGEDTEVLSQVWNISGRGSQQVSSQLEAELTSTELTSTELTSNAFFVFFRNKGLEKIAAKYFA